MDISKEGFNIRGIKPKYGESHDRYEEQVEEYGTREKDGSQYGVKGKLHSSVNLPDNPTAILSSSVRI